jgi:hypothetical protein
MSDTAQRVSDEAWNSVRGKRLPTAWAWAVVAAVVVLVIAVTWVVRGGYLVPQLDASVTGSAATADSGTFDLRFTLTNEGSSDVTVSDIRTGASWLSIAAVTWPEATNQGAGALPDPALAEVLPLTLGPHSGIELRLVLTVDCDKRTSEGVPLLVDARSLAGTHETVFVPMATAPLILSGNSAMQPWPLSSVDWVCTPYQGDDA